MTSPAISTVGVVGAGTMGSGIAQVLAQNGFTVRLLDTSEEILTRAEGRILSGLQKAGKAEAMGHITKTTRMRELSECDLVIEAAMEALDIKQDIFRHLDELLESPKILATNTSSLSIQSIMAPLHHPERALGLHFFNPAPILRLVEVIRGTATSEETVQRGLELARRLGKTPVLCKDTPGFIANRVARPFYLAGMRLLENGAGTPLELDAAVRAQKFKMGPFELMDLIGLDVNLAISQVIYEALKRPEHLKPSETQAKLVARKCLGRKTSRGFYLYGEGAAPVANPILRDILPAMGSKPLTPERIFEEILESVIGEARRAAKEGIASESDIDTAMCLGLNWPKGPLAWGRKLSPRS